MTITAKIIADSISEQGVRLTTLQIRYPRFIHGEFLTHRVFSRNASSSRAIPILTMLKRVWSETATPVHWGANQKGMQAKSELKGFKQWVSRVLWNISGKVACVFSYAMYLCGLHKQIANRITEPWQHIEVVVTATDWDNFMALRDHEDAQPEIRVLAQEIKAAMTASKPVLRKSDPRDAWSWHLPYVFDVERLNHSISELLAMSSARCARVSYLTHDKQNPKHENDIKLHDSLVGSVPIHASPTEHQAFPMTAGDMYFANFRGWKQYRKQVEATIARKFKKERNGD